MKEKSKEQQDRHLDVPAEANRDKHINFLEAEENRQETANNTDDDSPFYIPPNTPLKNVDKEDQKHSDES